MNVRHIVNPIHSQIFAPLSIKLFLNKKQVDLKTDRRTGINNERTFAHHLEPMIK